MPTVHAEPTQRPARFGGLDGLRAIAVSLVLWYHFFPDALPGGFLGVDIFFAISGFLITSLLLREYDKHGSLRLARFWRRRARRLLPALALVLLLSSSLALLVRAFGAPRGGDLLVGLGGQLMGAALFVSNWVFIANGIDYFARDTPELFRNTWSLSIEEQFYIALPLLILLLLRMRGRSTRALTLTLLSITSMALMAGLSAGGADPTRVYFGSDTHIFGLLLGAALAAFLHPGQRVDAPRPAASPLASTPRGLARQIGYLVTTIVGFGVLGWLTLTLAEGSAASFQGGFQLATAATLAVIWAITRPGSRVGAALDVRPLRWIGERSYGIYLWHWPLLLIADAAVGLSAPWSVVPLTLAATLVLAATSHRFIEQPVRRFGVRRSLAMMVRPASYTPLRRTVAVALTVILLVTVPATGIAVFTAPGQSSAAEAIARGQRALDERGTRAGPGTDKATDESQSAPAAPPAAGSASPAAVEGRDINAVGDSVMLASLPELESAFPGISIDAEVSRGMGVGVGIAQDLAAQRKLRPVLVVGLGTNGPVTIEDLDAIRAIAGTRPVVLVNAHAERDWIPGVNETLAGFATAHRGVVVADWNGSVSGVPDALAGDDIHPNPSGGEIYANTLRAAIEELGTPGEGIGYGLPRR